MEMMTTEDGKYMIKVSLLINFLILGSKASTYTVVTVQRYKPSAYMFSGGSENGHFTQLLCRFLKSCTLARTKATYTAFFFFFGLNIYSL